MAKKVFVTGGAGYVGSVLIPKLLAKGYEVVVLDLFMYGDTLPEHPKLTQVKADLRDRKSLEKSIAACDAVIHLACISNDPSFELDAGLGKSINYDAFEPLVQVSRDAGVNRFIYASSSSVYGVREEPDVTEDFKPMPLTDYSKFKALCEDVLHEYQSKDFTTLIIRPATVCGYSPRLRLDLTVNILTNHAVNKGTITVFGGDQKRPNLHIEDMTDLYLQVLEEKPERIAGKVYNAGYENHTVSEIAQMVKNVIGPKVDIVKTPTNDNRSYHISSAKIARELGFKPRHTIEDAVRDLQKAFQAGKIPNSMEDPLYYNVKQLKLAQLR